MCLQALWRFCLYTVNMRTYSIPLEGWGVCIPSLSGSLTPAAIWPLRERETEPCIAASVWLTHTHIHTHTVRWLHVKCSDRRRERRWWRAQQKECWGLMKGGGVSRRNIDSGRWGGGWRTGGKEISNSRDIRQKNESADTVRAMIMTDFLICFNPWHEHFLLFYVAMCLHLTVVLECRNIQPAHC